MRTTLPLRALVAVVAALFVAGVVGGRLFAAPAAQGGTIGLILIGHVDVDGGPDPDCPTCNGSDQNTAEDQGDLDYAATDPLPVIEFAVFDMSGTEVGRGTTTANGDALQVLNLDVPELGPDEEYTVEIQSGPDGWQACRGETSRTIGESQIGPAGNGRLDFFFFKSEFCQTVATLTVDTGPTITPGGPTVDPNATPMPTATKKPSTGGERHKDKEQKLGAIAGVAFIDENQNGVIDPGEPGLDHVGINIHGGGLEKVWITGGPGNYSFDGLGVGEYEVFIQPGAEWKITTPSRYHVKVNGNHVVGIDFGLVRASAKPAAKASASVRMPATGIADFPLAPAFGGLATLLGGLAALGFVFERRRRG